jgi:hypothetical protein
MADSESGLEAVPAVEDLAAVHLDRDLDAVAGNRGFQAFEGRAAIVAVFDHVELASEWMRAQGGGIEGQRGRVGGFANAAVGSVRCHGRRTFQFEEVGAEVEATTRARTQVSRSSGRYMTRLPQRTNGGPSPLTR